MSTVSWIRTRDSEPQHCNHVLPVLVIPYVVNKKIKTLLMCFIFKKNYVSLVSSSVGSGFDFHFLKNQIGHPSSKDCSVFTTLSYHVGHIGFG